MAVTKGQGTTLKLNNVAISKRTTLSGPSFERATIDKTDLDSVAREYVGGLRDFGECSGTCNFDPSDAGQLDIIEIMAAAEDDGDNEWKIEMDGYSITFDGILTGFNYSGFESDALVTVDFTIKVSGAPTYEVVGGGS